MNPEELSHRLEKGFDRVYRDYDKYALIPIAMIVFSILVLGFQYANTGQLVERGLDFTGGSEITYEISEEATIADIEQVFQNEGRNDVEVLRQITGNSTNMIVRLPPPELTPDEAEKIMNDAGYESEVLGLSTLSAAVSDQFFIQAQMAFVMSFMIMSLVIFYAFKDLTPSLAVIFAAGGDIIFALAGMSLLGIPLTLGSLAALLMLIGYSVDTDILLSTRALKQKRGSLKSRMWKAIKTGVTMSSGGIAAFSILYLVSQSIVGPSELSNIAAVMVIGLLADMPLTWLGNTVILKKYIEGEIPEFDLFEKVIPWS